jgi:hypothetical protein
VQRFIQQHADQVTGVLSGFDRLRFRGTLRFLAYGQGMFKYLCHIGVLLKNFKAYAQSITEQVRDASERLASAQRRPLIYLNSPKVSKEQTARKIAEKDGIREGLICVFSAVESCFSYEIRRDPQKRRLELRGRPQKCLHYYFYLEHPQFGFMHLRLQTWLPLSIHIAINGRQWLARQLDAAGIGYRRADNCFVELEDPPRAQQLADRQLKTRWKSAFLQLLREFHPMHREIFRECPLSYYWSLEQSEWATDILFRTPQALAEFYPRLLRHAAHNFSSAEVMRYLGRKMPLHGGIHGHFQGEVVSDVSPRADHFRAKHRVGDNWIKMYDKQQTVLRVETTINDTTDFKAFRRPEGETSGPRQWLPLRKGTADIKRRAHVSQAANERYLDALAAVSAAQPLGELTKALCRPTELAGKRVRALQPWSPGDAELLAAISRPEFALNGFRNRDLRALLHDGASASAEETRRQSARISRQLRLLRAHGLILKVAHTHRYQLTAGGRTILAGLHAASRATTEQLAKLAA